MRTRLIRQTLSGRSVLFLAMSLLVLILVSACSGGGGGTFSAELAVVDATRSEQLQIRKQELDAEPETLTLNRNGSFTLTRGANTVWEGTWRKEESQIYLLATSVMGNAVSSGFQEEVAFSMPDANTIIDDRMSASGYHLIFRKQ